MMTLASIVSKLCLSLLYLLCTHVECKVQNFIFPKYVPFHAKLSSTIFMFLASIVITVDDDVSCCLGSYNHCPSYLFQYDLESSFSDSSFKKVLSDKALTRPGLKGFYELVI